MTKENDSPEKKVEIPPSEWKKRLSKEQYAVLREKETECAFTGAYNSEKRKGIYLCAGCHTPLFQSDSKYDSGSGWPSFFQPIDPSRIGYSRDESLLTIRVEVHCASCGGHLGHVFNDGPPPTGFRYCINSISLLFQPGER